MSGLRLHERTQPVAVAGNVIHLALIKAQEEHDLTDVEMLQVINQYQASLLKYMLRFERHPDDPDARGDEE